MPLCAWQRVLMTAGLRLAPEPPLAPPLAPRLKLWGPDFLVSLHAGKPGDLYAYFPWQNDALPKGDCESAKAAVAARQVTLPSPYAIAKLCEDSEGQALFTALSEQRARSLTEQSAYAAAARPSRFAVLLAAVSRDAARARMANLPMATAAFEAGEALVSGAVVRA